MINLKEVITKYPECLESASKLRSYLVDLYPNEKRNITIITTIFDCGIASEIKNTNGVVEEFKIASYCNRLENDYAYSPKFTKECLNLWIEAYSITKKQPVVKNDDAKKNKKAKTATIKTDVSEMEKAFEQLFPKKELMLGQIVEVCITGVDDDGITVDIRDRNIENVKILKEDMVGAYDKNLYKGKINSKIRAMVINRNPLKLSQKAVENLEIFDRELESIKNGKIFEAQIISTNKGGLIGKYIYSGCQMEVFIPKSLINIKYESDIEKYIGKTLRLIAKEVKGTQIIASHRDVLERELQIKKGKKENKNDYINPDDVVFEEKATDLDFLEAIKSIEETNFVIGQKFLTQIVSITEDGLLVSIPNKKKEQIISCENLINHISHYKKGDIINVYISKLSPFTLVEKI